MFGISCTGLRGHDIHYCLNAYAELEQVLNLGYLELAIGVISPTELDYPMPLVLHDSSIYTNHKRHVLSLGYEQSYAPYVKLAKQKNIRAYSLHAPRREAYSSTTSIVKDLYKLQDMLGCPVYVENMDTDKFWNNANPDSWIPWPWCLDVSHVNIWCQGNQAETQQLSKFILNTRQVGEIHLSHNNGQFDNHRPVPADTWFMPLINSWAKSMLVTWESLPYKYARKYQLQKQTSPVQLTR